MSLAENYAKEIKAESPYSIVKIPRDKIQTVWRACVPFLEVGLSVAPELKMESVIDGLADESIQLWVVLEDADDNGSELVAVFLTSIERDRSEWVVSLYAMSGRSPREWLGECDRMMQSFAVAEDAKRIRMCGRKAWLRLLPKQFAITGVRSGHYVYERDVDPDWGRIKRVNQ